MSLRGGASGSGGPQSTAQPHPLNEYRQFVMERLGKTVDTLGTGWLVFSGALITACSDLVEAEGEQADAGQVAMG